MLDLRQDFGDFFMCVKVGVILALIAEGFFLLGQCCFDFAVRDDIERGHVCFDVRAQCRLFSGSLA